jgi:15-cis-phytoene synthase
MSPHPARESHSLEVLYAQAAEAARTGSRSLFLASKIVPPELARSAHAIFWFCDYTRELSRGAKTPEQGHSQLNQWAAMADSGLRGHLVRHPVLEVYLDTAERFGIPHDYPLEFIEGARMDLTHRRYESFSQLCSQCRRTGGMVSLMMSHVVGFRNPALDYMADLGLAVDLTIHLRDIGKNLARGRVYLPIEEMRAFGYSQADLECSVRNEAFRNLMRYQADRVHGYYQKAEPGLALLDPRGRFAVKAAFDLYRQTLVGVEKSGFDVFRSRPAVPSVTRYWITARSMAGPVTRKLWRRMSA